MDIKIKNAKTGNCGCFFCGKLQEGNKMHPYTVWYRRDTEKRGHNDPVCSIECAKSYVAKLQAE